MSLAGFLFLVGVMLANMAPPAAAAAREAGGGQIVTGRAEVLSPDLIGVGHRLVLLFGVDAPEERQPCYDARGRRWNCAVAAAKTLLDLVGDFEVTCESKAPDWRRRMYGVCRANNKIINEEMIRAGMAMMIREETLAYGAAEDEARAAKRGIWAGPFEPPWVFRRSAAGARQPLRRPAKVPPPTPPE